MNMSDSFGLWELGMPQVPLAVVVGNVNSYAYMAINEEFA